jgi:hypothetical protein
MSTSPVNPFADSSTPQTPQANPANPFLDASPAQPAQTQTPQDPRAGLGMGVIKGIGDTVHGVGQLIQGAGNLVSPGLGDKIIPPQGQTALDSMDTAQTPAEHVGKAVEMIGEFMGGDEALKGLSIVDKVKHLGAVAKIMTDYPTIARMVTSGAVGAATAGGETLVKTGSPTKAAEAAAAGGVVGAALPAASGLWNSATGKTIQDSLQGGLRSVLGDAAETAEVEPATGAVRDSAKSLADAVTTKSKGLFQTIDDATDGQLTNVQNKIRNVDFKLRTIAGTDDAAEEKLLSQKEALNESLDNVMELAKQNGVDPTVADNARASWKQASALNDLDAAVKGSTFGDAVHAPEVVDPKKLVSRLQKLDDSGRLQEALGDEGADTLVGHAYDALKSANRRAVVGKVASKLAVPAAVAATGGALYEGAKALHGN